MFSFHLSLFFQSRACEVLIYAEGKLQRLGSSLQIASVEFETQGHNTKVSAS
jgi:hypothetical protein